MAEEPPPSATLYLRNIDEKIKIPALIEAIREIFEDFGTVIDVIAKKNIKAKGQAFVVFESVEEAQEALDALNGFDLFDRPMEIQFAKTRSDATVEREDGEAGLEQHKRKRIAEKERKKALAAAEEAANPTKRPAAENLAERPAKTTKAVPSATDEWLPPNKILILRELPDDYGKEQLTAVFSRYPGFKEVRTVPGRTGIAFAEYEEEAGAISAREAMNGVTLGDKSIRVTYQRS